ncbi:MAG TPA: hypothetical protein VFQ41_01010, partial [Candidatus Angelobacter sp.]|nr:hypothetical protein [Candidatus Angelobacter sp.]
MTGWPTIRSASNFSSDRRRRPGRIFESAAGRHCENIFPNAASNVVLCFNSHLFCQAVVNIRMSVSNEMAQALEDPDPAAAGSDR